MLSFPRPLLVSSNLALRTISVRTQNTSLLSILWAIILVSLNENHITLGPNHNVIKRNRIRRRSSTSSTPWRPPQCRRHRNRRRHRRNHRNRRNRRIGRRRRRSPIADRRRRSSSVVDVWASFGLLILSLGLPWSLLGRLRPSRAAFIFSCSLPPGSILTNFSVRIDFSESLGPKRASRGRALRNTFDDDDAFDSFDGASDGAQPAHSPARRSGPSGRRPPRLPPLGG